MGFPAPLSQKDRLESFETTDMVWATKLMPPPAAAPEMAEVTGEDSLETGLNDKATPRKETRRFPSKLSDNKIKNKIRKLKGFWKERARMMPHMFKLLFREDADRFELHDLSMKGAAGGKGDSEARDAGDEDEPFELCDIGSELPFDFERASPR